jgi:hypothetical protein
MSDGFQVVMQDLLALSSTFRTEAETCKAIMPADGPTCPDGGDGALNGMMRSVTEALGLAHLQLSGAMDLHAGKLQAAHGRYGDTEMSLAQLARNVTAQAGIG